jgi:hypothetical protein
MGAGHPVLNFYAAAPLTAAALSSNNNNRSVYLGPNPGPGKTKHLHTLTVDTSAASNPSTYILADYLLYYPFIDTDSSDPQTMDNTETLPRYVTGEGVQCFVVTQGGMIGANFNSVCTMEYTNSDGVTGRTTTFALIGSPVTGTIVCAGNDATAASTTQCSPFVPLATGDKGIRSIQTITVTTPIGGVCAFVLCYTIASIPQLTNVTQVEKTFFSRTGRAPRIEDTAFLHFLMTNSGTNGPAPGVFRSSLTFVWG